MQPPGYLELPEQTGFALLAHLLEHQQISPLNNNHPEKAAAWCIGFVRAIAEEVRKMPAAD